MRMRSDIVHRSTAVRKRGVSSAARRQIPPHNASAISETLKGVCVGNGFVNVICAEDETSVSASTMTGQSGCGGFQIPIRKYV
jgi:hypothetical protein